MIFSLVSLFRRPQQWVWYSEISLARSSINFLACPPTRHAGPSKCFWRSEELRDVLGHQFQQYQHSSTCILLYRWVGQDRFLRGMVPSKSIQKSKTKQKNNQMPYSSKKAMIATGQGEARWKKFHNLCFKTFPLFFLRLSSKSCQWNFSFLLSAVNLTQLTVISRNPSWGIVPVRLTLVIFVCNCLRNDSCWGAWLTVDGTILWQVGLNG